MKFTFASSGPMTHQLHIEAGKYVGIEIEQLSVAVSAVVIHPNGEKKEPVLGVPPRIPFGVGILAAETGTYKIVIEPQTPGSVGEYAIRWMESLDAADRYLASNEPRYRSPRLEALFAGGDLTAFWQEVEKTGTPLIEPYAIDPNYHLVSFLYRGSASTKGVLVRWYPHVRSDYSNCLMQQWGNSGLWYRTFLVGSRARFTYDLVENPGPSSLYLIAQSLRPIDEARWSTIAHRVEDPFNKLPVDGTHGVELPKAAQQPYQKEKPEIPHGSMELVEFSSKILANQRKLQVYLPPGYAKSGGKYPVLLVMDGPRYTSSVPTPSILDQLIAMGRIRPLVAVFIPNVSTELRYRELGCNPVFSDALEQELIPLIATRYRISQLQRDRGIGGSSRAGLMAVCAALHKPKLFGKVISQSPLLWYDPSVDYFVDDINRYKRDPGVAPNWAANEIVSRRRLAIEFHLDAGTFEANTNHPGNAAILESTRHFRDVLRAKGYSVHYQEFEGGHEYFNWRGTFADAISALFAKSR